MKISIVIICYNEKKNLTSLIHQSKKLIKQFNNIREIKTITIDNEDNAISAKELSVRLKKSDILTSHSSSIEDAIESLSEKYPTSRILICGSLYLAGQVLKKTKGTL